MSDYDDSLEIGIAAGLDPATALVISEHDDNPSPPNGPGFLTAGPLGCAAIVVLFAFFCVVLSWLLH